MEMTIEREEAVGQVRRMAYQFADLYFAFVDELHRSMDEESMKRIATRVLYRRAKERADAMIVRARELGLERTPENIGVTSDVPYLGWVPELGCEHCPYGAQWLKRIKEAPWFEPYAALYCDVTDTTIAEVFTGKYTHRLTENVVHGAQSCERIYTEDDRVAQGFRTYGE